MQFIEIIVALVLFGAAIYGFFHRQPDDSGWVPADPVESDIDDVLEDIEDEVVLGMYMGDHATESTTKVIDQLIERDLEL